MNIKLLGLSLIGCLFLSGCANKLAIGSYHITSVKDNISLVDCKSNKNNELNFIVDDRLEYYLNNDGLPFIDYQMVENYKATINMCKIDNTQINLKINEVFKFNGNDSNMETNAVVELDKCSNNPKPYRFEYKKDINLVDKSILNKMNNNELSETSETLVHVVYDSFIRNMDVCLEDDGKIKVDGHLLFHKVKPIIEYY